MEESKVRVVVNGEGKNISRAESREGNSIVVVKRMTVK